MTTTKLKERLKKAKKPKKGVEKYIYSVLSGDTKNEVLCKLCGAVIRFEKDIDGRKVMRETSLYTEVELEFDDGSKHVTPLCKKCSHGMDDEQREFIYAMDVQQWINEDNAMGNSIKEGFWKQQEKRKVKSYKISRQG